MKSNNTKTMKNTVDLNEKSRKQKNKRKRAEAKCPPQGRTELGQDIP